jgi:Protein of unknown function (DUF2568)
MNLSAHPLLLALRFLLELSALAAFARFGFQLGSGSTRYVWAIALPLLAALAWGTFAVPDDPSRSGKAPIPVPGALRLALELAFFGAAAWAFFASHARTVGFVFSALVLCLHVASLDRLVWLLRR